MRILCALTIFLINTHQSHSMDTEKYPLLDNKAITERYNTSQLQNDFTRQQPAYRPPDQHSAHYTVVVTIQAPQTPETIAHTPTDNQLPIQQNAPVVQIPQEPVWDAQADDRLHHQRRNQALDAQDRANRKFGCCVSCVFITTVIGVYMIYSEIEKHKIWAN